jgi:hypothetical protein
VVTAAEERLERARDLASVADDFELALMYLDRRAEVAALREALVYCADFLADVEADGTVDPLTVSITRTVAGWREAKRRYDEMGVGETGTAERIRPDEVIERLHAALVALVDVQPYVFPNPNHPKAEEWEERRERALDLAASALSLADERERP